MKSKSQPTFIINKPVSMVDEKINITVANLEVFQQVTIIGRITDHTADYISHGHFIADVDGSVSTSHHASMGGTYRGIEPMGIIWSMIPSSDAKRSSRLSKKYVTTPYKVQLAVVNGYQDIKRWCDVSDALCEAQLERWYLASDTEQIKVTTGRLRGTIFSAKHGGKRAGLIDLFGTAGGLVEMRAALLASYGYTTLALAYFDYEDLPKGVEFDLDYFDEAIEFMCNHPRVDASQGLGVLGVSKGSEIALHMASYSTKIKACVAINGGHYYSFGTHTYKGRLINTHMHDYSRLIYSDEGLITAEAHAVQGTADLIPVERSKSHFLLIQSADDQALSYDHALTAAKRIRDSGNLNCVVKIYSGAGHLLEPPYMPLCTSVYHKYVGNILVYGGEPRLHAIAQEQSWINILIFLSKHFKNDYTRVGRVPLSNL